MNRVLLLAILAYLLVLVGLATRTGELLALALPLIAYLASGLLYGPQPIRLQVERSTSPDRLSPGDPVSISLSITNYGSALETVLLEDHLPEGIQLTRGENSILAIMPAGATLKMDYTVKAGRGLFSFQGLRVSASDRLNIFNRRVEGLAPGKIQVLPNAPQLKRFPIRPRITRVYSGLIPARQGGSGVDFFGVREYQAGDAFREINWRVTARFTDSLFSNDFEQERVADIGIILDARSRTNITTSQGALFEHQVAATAALASALLRDGNRVGLLVYGGYLDWTFPGYGKLQRERILQSLARAQIGESSIFNKLEYLPKRIFPTRSQLVLISPLVSDDLAILIHLRARGYPVLVISANPITYEKATSPEDGPSELAFRLAALERSLLISNLMHAGVQVMEWDIRIPFDQAVKTAEIQLSRAQVMGRILL
jgi:uncharacterized protein (DUF58 family)